MHVEQSRPPLIPVSKNNIAHLTSHDMLIRRDNHIYYFNVHYLILNKKNEICKCSNNHNLPQTQQCQSNDLIPLHMAPHHMTAKIK